MPRGGPRPNAGRRAGGVNKVDSRIKDRVLANPGMLPLEYMLAIMRDPKQTAERRDAMARAAAPYLHVRMMSHEVMGKGGAAIEMNTRAQVIVHLPDNHRRVTTIDAANEALTFSAARDVETEPEEQAHAGVG